MSTLKKISGWIPARFVLAFLIFLAAVTGSGLQLNLNLTIVAMVNQTSIGMISRTSEGCLPRSTHSVNSTSSHKSQSDGEFAWSQYTQGMLLGAIFYGYICTHAMGGLLVQKFGGKTLVLCSMLIPAFLTILIPTAARLGGAPMLFALRVIQGAAMGILAPVLYAIVACWTPVLERSLTVAVTHIGGMLGGAFTIVLTGYLTAFGVLGGWPSVFYLTGAFGCVFSLAWFALAHETPNAHPTISDDELMYITKSLERSTISLDRKERTPWKSILTSVPLWSLLIVRFACSWSQFTIQTAVPLYLQTGLSVPIELNGIVNGLMYIVSTASSFICGIAADKIRRKTNLKITTIRKVFSSIAYVGAAISWVCITTAGCNTGAAFALIIMVKFFLAVAIGGDYVTLVDMAPQYAGPLSGIIYTLSDVPGFLSPLITGIITEDDVTLDRWHSVFCLAAAILLLGLVIFVLFGSAELQPWACNQVTEEKKVLTKDALKSIALLQETKPSYESLSKNSEDV